MDRRQQSVFRFGSSPNIRNSLLLRLLRFSYGALMRQRRRTSLRLKQSTRFANSKSSLQWRVSAESGGLIRARNCCQGSCCDLDDESSVTIFFDSPLPSRSSRINKLNKQLSRARLRSFPLKTFSPFKLRIRIGTCTEPRLGSRLFSL